MLVKTKKERSKKSWLEIIGFLLIFVGLLLIIYHFVSRKVITTMEQEAIKNFYIEQQEVVVEDNQNDHLKDENQAQKTNKIEYIAVIKIPKINLIRGLVDRNSYLNNISYNVEILDDSNMPDEENGNVILAAHSGNASISYFQDLDKLVVGDKVTIDYKGKTYNYKVVRIYDIEKKGTLNLNRNNDISTLTLITCRHNTNNQIIVICELEK